MAKTHIQIESVINTLSESKNPILTIANTGYRGSDYALAVQIQRQTTEKTGSDEIYDKISKVLLAQPLPAENTEDRVNKQHFVEVLVGLKAYGDIKDTNGRLQTLIKQLRIQYPEGAPVEVVVKEENEEKLTTAALLKSAAALKGEVQDTLGAFAEHGDAGGSQKHAEVAHIEDVDEKANSALLHERGDAERGSQIAPPLDDGNVDEVIPLVSKPAQRPYDDFMRVREGRDSYFHLWNDEKNPTPLDRAKAILEDYTKGGNWMKLLFTCHLGRHHVKEVQAEIKNIQDGKHSDVNGVLNALKNIKLDNQQGSLARRISFIEQYVKDESTMNERYDVIQANSFCGFGS